MCRLGGFFERSVDKRGLFRKKRSSTDPGHLVFYAESPRMMVAFSINPGQKSIIRTEINILTFISYRNQNLTP